MPNVDAFDLQRFVTAQEPMIDTALAELRAGHKRTHWMWFIFPQLRGLGQSSMALHYGISTLEEARAYLQHPELGPRLVASTQVVLGAPGASLHDIFGSPDDMKFRSSMTLFALAAEGSSSSIYHQALDKWCNGKLDPKTVHMLTGKRDG
ncbi:MAG: DUF1810 domain-containing protein [Alphaproteobacteria bacterium]|nr:DUF1810 domain-containing protein [Alphaproteobacteria bacterium]